MCVRHRGLRWQTIIVAGVLSALTASGCAAWKPASSDPSTLIAEGEEGPVRVVKLDGSTIVLAAPALSGDSLIGTTPTEPPQRVAIARADVTAVQKKKLSYTKTMDNALTATRITMGAVTLATTLLIFHILGFP